MMLAIICQFAVAILLFNLLCANSSRIDSFRPYARIAPAKRLAFSTLRMTDENNNFDAEEPLNDSNRIIPKDNVENVNVKTYIFGKEGEFSGDVRRLGIDMKRFVTYNALAVLLALGANFFGVTSAIMSSTSPEYFRSFGLDQLYSVGGFRKHVDSEDKYEYIFPEKWLVDQSVLLADARERDLPRALRERRPQGTRPDSAYGPAGGDGKENISVIKSRIMPGFSLRGTLGEPREAAERLLRTVIAAPGTGKEYELISAYEDTRDGSPAYVFEYTVKKEAAVTSDSGASIPGRPGFYQHSISVIMYRGSELFTYTAVSPQAIWEEVKDTLSTSAKSFKITEPSLPAGFY